MTKHRASTRGRRTTACTIDAGAPLSGGADTRLADLRQATAAEWREIGAEELAEWHRHAANRRSFAIDHQAPHSPARHLIEPADLPCLATFLAALPRAKLPVQISFRVAAGAAPHWLRLLVLRRSGRGRERRYAAVLTDISPLKRLEQDLLQVNERVQNRIGQELHDDLCQVLAGLSCLTRVLENRIAPQLPHEVDNLRELNRQLVDAMDRTRALTHGLYPARMRSGDARAALLELAKEVGIRFGVTVRTAFHGRFPGHTAEEILQVYRIAQEAISNAIRHGRASQIELELECRNGAMEMAVRDNGTGLPKAEAQPTGIGLQIMRHRAAQIGGKIQVGNAPRHGALVLLHYQPVARL